MKKCLLIVLLIGVSTNSIWSQGIIEQLQSKEWKGSGTLMGQDALFSMKWESILKGKFIQLSFQNERSSNNKTIIFQARGVYQIEENTVNGMWFDSRGIQFPLKGTVSDTELIIFWGTPETEEGKTIYSLSEAQILVTDFILSNGEYHPFGKAVYE